MFRSRGIALLIALAGSAPQALGHGYVESIVANGVNYTGWAPVDLKGVQKGGVTPIRQVDTEGPVLPKLWDTPMIACGRNDTSPSASAAIPVPVNAGSNVVVQVRLHSPGCFLVTQASYIPVGQYLWRTYLGTRYGSPSDLHGGMQYFRLH